MKTITMTADVSPELTADEILEAAEGAGFLNAAIGIPQYYDAEDALVDADLVRLADERLAMLS